MKKGNSYNGFSPEERNKKFKVLQHLIRMDLLPLAKGPCDLCGDPESPVEYHSEDYGEPYLWTPPAMYCLCRHCHRDKLHKRFWRQDAWHAFIAHIRRGGYAKDLKDAIIKSEVDMYRFASIKSEEFRLVQLRPYKQIIGHEWFIHLNMNPRSLIDSLCRPKRNSNHEDTQ